MASIVVLDGYTLNPGDLSWEPLTSLARCAIYERTAEADVVQRAAEAEIVLTNKTPLQREMLAQLPRLRFVGVLATGFNIVDVRAARERGIPVSNVPAYSTDSVAQLVFAHLLNLTHHVDHHARSVQAGRWSTARDFCYWDTPLIELKGLTMGIIGYGRIGAATTRIARAFGMEVLAHDPDRTHVQDAGVEWAALDDVFRRSDVVSLHCPLTTETEGLVNRHRLGMMKSSAFLINTSRGPLVDETALAEALAEGTLAGAGLDVLSVEPPPATNPLLTAPGCLITPHIAWATRAARERLLASAAANVRAFLQGSPINVVNGWSERRPSE
jgi:glycerate dehydrogenase